MSKLVLPLALIAAGFAGLLVVGVLEGGMPEIQVREIHESAYAGRFVKMHGRLHSIESNERPLRFTVRDAGRPDVLIPVYADKTRPDTFKVDYDIAVEGRWDEAGKRFQAEKIMTKCPSKYEAEEKRGVGSPEMRRETAPPGDPPGNPPEPPR